MFESVMYERKIEKKRLSKLYLLCVGGVVCDLIAYYIKGDSNDLLFSLMGFVLYTIVIGIDMIAGYVEQERKLEMQRVELANSRMAIMISQIQPHFLYNVLNSIHYLCEKDPKTAQKAIGEFSDYLRVNLDSIKRKVPVPFETELKHVKTYLKLEKMRFGDELQIVYDIQVQSFLIPSLTLQPIAENAVKHGVGKKTGGGTVWIRTEENADCYMIVVEDDGVGYAPQQTTDDGRSHIGVENVGKRLKEMVQGTLTIEGLEQGGTKAVISIPKQKEEN
jgi:LytS/YehU family sensor histidine kinase